MIRSEQAIVHYDFRTRRVHPDRLLRGRDQAYLPAAQRMIDAYRDGVGRSRQQLHDAIEAALADLPACPPRRAAAFAKLLDDASEYHTGKASAGLRRRVFEIGARLHPIVQQRSGIFEHDLATARQAAADALELTWEEIQARMFADVIELQRLKTAPPSLTPADLLARYNTAQTQAALYRANQVDIWISDQAPYLIRQAKLAGLMHRVRKAPGLPEFPGEAFRIQLDGPASVLRDTSRYGIRFASLLPSLLACEHWRFRAEVVGPQNQLFRLTLAPTDGLSSTATPPPEFDSQLEQAIAAAWQADPVAGWRLERNRNFFVQGQQLFTPDFILTHDSGHLIVVEVIGFWTPEYLRDKQQRLGQVAQRTNPPVDWLLILDGQALTPPRRQALAELGLPMVAFQKSLPPSQWIAVATAGRRPT